MLLAGRLCSHREEHLLGMLTVLLLGSCWDVAKVCVGSINPSVASRVRDVPQECAVVFELLWPLQEGAVVEETFIQNSYAKWLCQNSFVEEFLEQEASHIPCS